MASRAIVAVLGLVLAGTSACAGTSSPTGSPSASASASAVSTPDPSGTPIATASSDSSPSGASGPEAVTEGPLEPGTYRSESLGITATFELDEGWIGAGDIPEAGFALIRDGIDGGVTFTAFPGEVFSDPCSSEAKESLDATADAFVGWLSEHPELNADERTETKLGELDALQLDVTADVDEPCSEGPRIWLWVLPVVGDFHLDEDEAARFIASDVGDTVVVVVIETFDPADQQALLDAAEPVLESLSIEPQE